MPSPNQTSSLNLIPGSGGSTQSDDGLSYDQMKLFADRLQPEHWLAPSNIAWVRPVSSPLKLPKSKYMN